MYNPFSLNDKIILVTGASSGIGRAIAIENSKMGAKVVITGRNEQRLQETYQLLIGSGHLQIKADLLLPESISQLIGKIDKLDGMVLCAGMGMTCPFLFSDRKVMDEVFNINLYSQTELLRLAVKEKKLNKNSSVVFISSVGGIHLFNVGNSAYSASKAAINAMMKIAALELANKRIRVNSVNPGMIETNLLKGGSLTEEQLNEDAKRYPLKRYGDTSDVAYSVVYLLSDASSWVTGINLIIDGGISI